MKPTNADLQAGKGRLCPDCLRDACLVENQVVYGNDGGGFGGTCGTHLACMCACRDEYCRRNCLSEYNLACQRAVGALDLCRRKKCVPTCDAVGLYPYGRADAGPPPDAGPWVDQACRQPSDGGTPCCDLLAHCCQELEDGGIDAGDALSCWTAYAEVHKSEGSCGVVIPTWEPLCPGARP